jgi:hypothetical protein
MYGLGGWIDVFFGVVFGVNAFLVFVIMFFVPLVIFVNTEGLLLAAGLAVVVDDEENGHSDPPSAMPVGDATNSPTATLENNRSVLLIAKPLPWTRVDVMP